MDDGQHDAGRPAEMAARHVERIMTRLRERIDEVAKAADDPPIETAAVIGAGLMGIAIAATHVKVGVPVTMADADLDALAAAPARIAAELALQLAAEDETVDAEQRVDQLVTLASGPEQVAACDIIVETVTESAAVKQAVYDQLSPHLCPTTVLTTNTSTIPLGELATGAPRAEQFCGFHFFHPVRRRSLVEIIPHATTDDATVRRVARHARRIAKTPITVQDGPGFLVNRLLNPYLSEAMEMLLEGVAIERIERAATQFGMAMGPLRILDEIGLDVALHGGRTLWLAFPQRVVPSPLLIRMVKRKRLGRKTGRGFFQYDSGASWDGDGTPDPEVDAMIDKWKGEERPIEDAGIADRLILGMLLEGVRMLEEGVVTRPDDIDIAVVHGLGFPRDRGGLLYWCDALGASEVLKRLAPFQSLGERFEPPVTLQRMATSGERFFDET